MKNKKEKKKECPINVSAFHSAANFARKTGSQEAARDGVVVTRQEYCREKAKRVRLRYLHVRLPCPWGGQRERERKSEREFEGCGCTLASSRKGPGFVLVVAQDVVATDGPRQKESGPQKIPPRTTATSLLPPFIRPRLNVDFSHR